MSVMEKKSFQEPEDTKRFGGMTIESITVGGTKCTRATAAPGWRWARDVKPVVQTESCQVHHSIFMIAGRIRTRMDDGTELEFKAGDMGDIPPGHDGWTVGDETAVWLDFPH